MNNILATDAVPAGRDPGPGPGLAPGPDPGLPLQGCTNFKLRQLLRRVAQHYDAEVGKSGLKTTQYSLLTHVLHLGPIQLSDLAAAMTLDASTLTRNLKPLVASGWLVVSEGVNGRSRKVCITEAGRDKRREAQQHWKQAQLRLNDLLSPQRVAALHRLVDESLALLAPEPSGEHDE